MKLLTVITICLLAPLYAVDISAPTILTDPALALNNAFGSSTAISERYYAITSPGAQVDSEATGIIFIYDAATQEAVQKLIVPDPKPNDLVGASLTITGNYLIAGLPEANEEQGKVVVWDIETGNVYHTYTHPEPQNGDRFGHDVAVNGKRFLVGVPKDETSTTRDLTIDSGSAYLFDLGSKQFLKSFVGKSDQPGDSFGTSVALTAEKILVGCPNYDAPEGEGNEGAVYVFSQTSYALEDMLKIEGSDAMASFGFDLAAQEDTLVVSAYRGFSSENLCYVFDLATGTPTAKLAPPTSDRSTFGLQVAIGEVLAVSDSFADRTGKLYLYDREGELIKTISAPEAASGDQFSSDIAFSGCRLIVGAKGVDVTVDDTMLFNAGRAYVYSIQQSLSLRIQLVNNEVKLNWNSTAGQAYQIMMSKTLKCDDWEAISSTAITASGNTASYSINSGSLGRKAFFKVVGL